jgi:ArsR family transcriptional regulator
MAQASTDLKGAVTLFHALSDETRLEILDRLRNGEQCVCELTDFMKAAQSRLSLSFLGFDVSPSLMGNVQ